MSDLDTCKRELATLFAHFVAETGKNSDWDAANLGIERYRQGLYYLTEIGCAEGTNDDCDYYSSDSMPYLELWWPINYDKKYYGRGPFQLSYNYNYGAFSKVFEESTYNNKMELLDNPDKLTEDDYIAFSAGLWFYMNPQSPKPSMHDVMSGLFEPNDHDESLGIYGGFSSTINIINGG